MCAQCHVREAQLFTASPKKAIFDAMGQAECLVCHGNHAIQPPTYSFVGLDEGAVCATCHDGSVKGAETIRRFRKGLEGLTAAIATADTVVDRAEHAGMLVDDARLTLHEASEQLIQSRVAVHAFADAPFADLAAEGLPPLNRRSVAARTRSPSSRCDVRAWPSRRCSSSDS